MRKRFEVAVVTASLLGGAAIGGAVLAPNLAGASDPPSDSTVATAEPSTDATTADPGATSTTTDGSDSTTDEHPDAATRLHEVLDPLVADGTLTQAQEDAVIAALQDAGPFGGHGGDHLGGHFAFGPWGDLSAAAGALGITEDELRSALRDGQSLADIATANGVDVQAVVDAIVAQIDERIDQALADGHLTADQAATLHDQTAQLATNLVNGTLPDLGDLPGAWGPGGRGDHHHGGSDDDDDGGTDSSESTTTTTG